MKQQNTLPLITPDEIVNCFIDSELLEKKSFYYIEQDKAGYDTNRKPMSFIDEIQDIKQAYLNGHTIVIKNMENYNEAIRIQAAKYGRNVNVCMFLSPNEGSNFGWHNDEEDVHIHLIHGQKVFFVDQPIAPELVRGLTSSIHKCKLLPGDVLNIKPMVQHFASTIGSSIHISFGVIQKPHYLLAGGLTKQELGLE
jgi:hypothetical protein